MSIIERSKEEYIKPEEKGWESRYKRVLLLGESEYKEGLKWVYEYYKGKEVLKRWRYEGNYGPLMKEILKEKKKNEEEEKVEEKEISKEESLEYIMPKKGEEAKEYIWAYKRYFWEANIIY